jgi:hypothetical protein
LDFTRRRTTKARVSQLNGTTVGDDAGGATNVNKFVLVFVAAVSPVGLRWVPRWVACAAVVADLQRSARVADADEAVLPLGTAVRRPVNNFVFVHTVVLFIGNLLIYYSNSFSVLQH